MSALWFSVGEAYFICRFSVHFSHTFVFSQKLLFWSFFNFFIFFFLFFFKSFLWFPHFSFLFSFFFSFFLRLFWLWPYNSQWLSCTAEIDISLKSSQNGGWHRLGCHSIRSSFHRWKRGKRDIWIFLCSVFHVLNGWKWNEVGGNLAYVIRLSESFSEMYRSHLYMKAFASYK